MFVCMYVAQYIPVSIAQSVCKNEPLWSGILFVAALTSNTIFWLFFLLPRIVRGPEVRARSSIQSYRRISSIHNGMLHDRDQKQKPAENNHNHTQPPESRKESEHSTIDPNKAKQNLEYRSDGQTNRCSSQGRRLPTSNQACNTGKCQRWQWQGG